MFGTAEPPECIHRHDLRPAVMAIMSRVDRHYLYAAILRVEYWQQRYAEQKSPTLSKWNGSTGGPQRDQ